MKETRLPGVLLAKAAKARLHLVRSSLVKTEVPQVAKELHGLVVLAGLLGGDKRVNLAPRLDFALGKVVR